jgi:hypothetical protein
MRQINALHRSLKYRTLKILNSNGPLRPLAWAEIAEFYPARAAYSYLLRLHRSGLLKRSRDEEGLLLYSLTERGQKKLDWVMQQNKGNDNDGDELERVTAWIWHSLQPEKPKS